MKIRFLFMSLLLCLLSFAVLTGCDTVTHQHTFSDQWTSDETAHWHISTCEHSLLIADKSIHSFDEGIYHEATNEADAYTVYTCTVCKYERNVKADEKPDNLLNIQCTDGTPQCYSIDGNTITFSGITADSIYVISGKINGNIVIDVGDAYKFELEMRGLEISCDYASPIVILSGDKVTLTAKKDFENTVTDLRQKVNGEAAGVYAGAIHAKCDLEIGGKGKLTVVSKNNNGIRTKDDLEIKNLTLSVTCADNALKGDDSVTIKSGTIELIATEGDGIKTVNTDISSKGKQRGIVTISGGNVTIRAAVDGIDASYDVVIDENLATVKIEVYTDQS